MLLEHQLSRRVYINNTRSMSLVIADMNTVDCVEFLVTGSSACMLIQMHGLRCILIVASSLVISTITISC